MLRDVWLTNGCVARFSLGRVASDTLPQLATNPTARHLSGAAGGGRLRAAAVELVGLCLQVRARGTAFPCASACIHTHTRHTHHKHTQLSTAHAHAHRHTGTHTTHASTHGDSIKDWCLWLRCCSRHGSRSGSRSGRCSTSATTVRLPSELKLPLFVLAMVTHGSCWRHHTDRDRHAPPFLTLVAVFSLSTYVLNTPAWVFCMSWCANFCVPGGGVWSETPIWDTMGHHGVVRDSNLGHQLMLPPANTPSHVCVPKRSDDVPAAVPWLPTILQRGHAGGWGGASRVAIDRHPAAPSLSLH